MQFCPSVQGSRERDGNQWFKNQWGFKQSMGFPTINRSNQWEAASSCILILSDKGKNRNTHYAACVSQRHLSAGSHVTCGKGALCCQSFERTDSKPTGIADRPLPFQGLSWCRYADLSRQVTTSFMMPHRELRLGVITGVSAPCQA